MEVRSLKGGEDVTQKVQGTSTCQLPIGPWPATPYPDYVPCDGYAFHIAFDWTDDWDGWTAQVTMNLYPFPELTYTFLDGSTSPKTLPVMAGPLGARIEYSVDTHAYWGVVWFVVKVFDPLGAQVYAWTTESYKIPYDTDNDGIADGWEKDNGGFLHMDSLKSDPNCTSAVPDKCWDMEETTQFTNHFHGDGITKLQEYQGVMIGTEHHRLSPAVKEVFIDTLEAEYAAWAAQELETQLFLEAYLVAGVIGPGGVQSIAYPGSDTLKWLGENRTNNKSFRNYLKIKDQGHLYSSPQSPSDSLANGLMVLGGRYWTGLRVTDLACVTNHACAPMGTGVKYGETTEVVYKTGGHKPGFSKVFHMTIQNLLDVSVNSIPESVTHVFYYPIADGTGTAWYSIYNGTDIDGGGFGLVNPVDLLSPTSANDIIDALSGGQNAGDIIRINTLHELGHALGMGPGNTHDNTMPSPMVEGHGPYNISTFRAKDKEQFRLK